MPPFTCPTCDRSVLDDAGVVNAWECPRCGQFVFESLQSRAPQRVAEFYRRVRA
jgi:predicted RNA-binding Zn-ribbon protein involved in translation (DUF1610 family)